VMPIVELLIVVPVIVPPEIAAEDEAKLLAVVGPFSETVPVPVENVPVPVCVKLELFCTVTAPFEVKPEVAVMSPEMVGVAVQAVPMTVKFPPKEVRLLPETVNALSKVVAPCKVKVPVPFPIVVAAVPVELIKVVPKTVVEPLMAFVPPTAPMVLAANVPVPKVFVSEAPVPMVELPEEVSVMKLPAPPLIELEPAEIEENVAAPAPVIDHCASLSAKSELALPMVMMPVEVPVPMLVA